MTYVELIETISLIVENEKISKVGLSLTYELEEENYLHLNEQFFYMIDENIVKPFIPENMFEVEFGGIIIKITKKIKKDLHN